MTMPNPSLQTTLINCEQAPDGASAVDGIWRQAGFDVADDIIHPA